MVRASFFYSLMKNKKENMMYPSQIIGYVGYKKLTLSRERGKREGREIDRQTEKDRKEKKRRERKN